MVGDYVIAETGGSVWLFHMGSDRWVRGASRPTPDYDLSCGRVVYPDGSVKVVTAGGQRSSRFIYIYDVDTDSWEGELRNLFGTFCSGLNSH